MYTIHQGINGGWYGSITVDTSDNALAAAKELAEILDALRNDIPKAARASDKPATHAKSTEALTDAGLACLAYCEAHPRATHEEYTKAGHTLRTVKWLREHGYLKSVDGAWLVDRKGELNDKTPR